VKREGAQAGEMVEEKWGYLRDVVTLAPAGHMPARRSQTVLGGMQPAERTTSGRAWGR
jgi:hypothetical protein